MIQEQQFFSTPHPGTNPGFGINQNFAFSGMSNGFEMNKGRAMSINYSNEFACHTPVQKNLKIPTNSVFDMAFNDLKSKKASSEETQNEISIENVNFLTLTLIRLFLGKTKEQP